MTGAGGVAIWRQVTASALVVAITVMGNGAGAQETTAPSASGDRPTVPANEVARRSLVYRAEVAYQLDRWDYDVGAGIYNVLKTNSALNCPERATLDEVAERVPMLADIIFVYRASDQYAGTPAFDQIFKAQAEQFQSTFGDPKGTCRRVSEELSWVLQAHMVKEFSRGDMADIVRSCGKDILTCFYRMR